ncbi:MAG TPA: TetR/AcrR family transcriptional regulator [Thermoleophilia bacterium]|nr:TetR/AcrR family transcriptional regulator [Thermoleophilia bacterium]
MARARSTEETRRGEIVDAALRLILKNGFHNTTLDQVAVQAKVSKGLVSYYFPKKDELFLAVLQLMIERLRSDLESAYRAHLPARERLRLNFRNLFDNGKRTRQYYTVLIDFLGQALRERAVQGYTEVIYETVLTYVEWTITDGIRSGEFQEVDAHKVACMVVGMMEGLVLQWLFSRDSVELGDAYAMCERLVDDLLTIPPTNGSAAVQVGDAAPSDTVVSAAAR